MTLSGALLEQSARQSAEEELVAAARAVVAGAVDPLEGAIEVHRRWRQLCGDDLPYHEDAFTFLMGIESEMDPLPTSHDRALWAADALAEADKELAGMRAHYRESILQACRRVLEIFKMAP